MTGEPHRLTTEEERERLFTARNQGGLCGLCGRELHTGEPVYWDRFAVGEIGGFVFRPTAPVGIEGVSEALRQATEGVDPRPCAGCGRPVLYQEPRTARQWTACSRRCRGRAISAKARARQEGRVG